MRHSKCWRANCSRTYHYSVSGKTDSDASSYTEAYTLSHTKTHTACEMEEVAKKSLWTL